MRIEQEARLLTRVRGLPSSFLSRSDLLDVTHHDELRDVLKLTSHQQSHDHSHQLVTTSETVSSSG